MIQVYSRCEKCTDAHPVKKPFRPFIPSRLGRALPFRVDTRSSPPSAVALRRRTGERGTLAFSRNNHLETFKSVYMRPPHLDRAGASFCVPSLPALTSPYME